MTIQFHPNDELLLDYASGALGESWSLAVATHLALCPTCRRTVSGAESVAGSLLDGLEPEPLADDMLDNLMARLDQIPQETARGARGCAPSTGAKPVFPEPLRGMLGSDVGGLRWRRLGQGAHQVLIPTGDKGVTARLLRIPAGRTVPKHSHGGLELTLVLSGAFCDDTGHYHRGDLQQADEQLEHQPHAMAGEDCICLAVTDAPLRFRSLAVRLVQPWLGI